MNRYGQMAGRDKMKKAAKQLLSMVMVLCLLGGMLAMPCVEAFAEEAVYTVYSAETWVMHYTGEVRWIESSDYNIVKAVYSKDRSAVTFTAGQEGDAVVSVFLKYGASPVTYRFHVLGSDSLFSFRYVAQDLDSGGYVWEVHNQSGINFRRIRFQAIYRAKVEKTQTLEQGLQANATGVILGKYKNEKRAKKLWFKAVELEREERFGEGSKLGDQVTVVLERRNTQPTGTKVDFYVNNTAKERVDCTLYGYLYDTKKNKVLRTVEWTYFEVPKGLKKKPRTVKSDIRGGRLVVYCWASSLLSP